MYNNEVGGAGVGNGRRSRRSHWGSLEGIVEERREGIRDYNRGGRGVRSKICLGRRRDLGDAERVAYRVWGGGRGGGDKRSVKGYITRTNA